LFETAICVIFVWHLYKLLTTGFSE